MRIPMFFASDKNYLPYLAVTLQSVWEKSSGENFYEIILLSEGIGEDEVSRLLPMEAANMSLRIVDVSEKIASVREKLSSRLRDYYSLAIYYRLFIPSMFPEYSKALYLDCDIVFMRDAAELYSKELGENLLGVVADESIPSVPAFVSYVENWVGVRSDRYFNSGVLVMNLERMREERVEEQFIRLLSKYNFETVAPDQDYLNYLCRGRVKYLSPVWNKQPKEGKCPPAGEQGIIHYNLHNKPWRYSGIPYEEEFWRYAEKTSCYKAIKEAFEDFVEEDKRLAEEGGERLVATAMRLAFTEGGFASSGETESLTEGALVGK